MPFWGLGAPFFKLSGSGNDFVAFDQMRARALELPPAEVVRALCARGTGVGADGAMIVRPHPGADYELVYYNADGSLAELCGNASLCSVRLAVELGHGSAAGMRFVTGAGVMAGRIAAGLPEIDMPAPAAVDVSRLDLLADGLGAGEERIGYARVGVPHVVVLCTDASAVDLPARGPTLRHHPRLPDGANVNFVSRAGEHYAIRTYERGVEAETLACGTGSVASAVLLSAWSPPQDGPTLGPASGRRGGGPLKPPPAGHSEHPVVELRTRSGLRHRVTLRRDLSGALAPSLAGGAAIVFRGEIGELPLPTRS